MIEAYLRANKMFVDYSEVSSLHIFLLFMYITSSLLIMFLNQPQQEKVYSSYLQLELSDVEPCISGPKRYVMLQSCAVSCLGCILFLFFYSVFHTQIHAMTAFLVTGHMTVFPLKI